MSEPSYSKPTGKDDEHQGGQDGTPSNFITEDQHNTNAEDPNDASHRSSRLSRDRITPHNHHPKSAISMPWEVKVILLPSASNLNNPRKGSNKYWRLKSRGLISRAIIPGHDSDSIRITISLKFSHVLGGREWIPLRALEEESTSDIHLVTLGTTNLSLYYDYNFLAKNCLVLTSKETLKLFIAPRYDDLSWAFIRQLPRLQPRAVRIDQEDFWESEVNSDADEPVDKKENEPVRVLQPYSETQDSNNPSIPSSGSASVSTPAPNENPTISFNIKLLRTKDGKYPCPYSKCQRSRFPFKHEEFFVKHMEELHKARILMSDDGNEQHSNDSIAHIAEEHPVIEIGCATDSQLVGPSRTSYPAQRIQQDPIEDLVEHPKRRVISGGSLQSSSLATFNSCSFNDADKGEKEDGNHANEGCLSIPASYKSPDTALLDAGEDFSAISMPVISKGHTIDKILQYTLPIRTKEGGSHTGSSGAAETTTSQSSGESTSGGKTTRKRPRIDNYNEQNDEGEEASDDGGNGSHSNDGVLVENSASRKLACPFYKNDPEKYKTHKLCCGPGWKSVNRVR
jgi:hypothetical protein